MNEKIWFTADTHFNHTNVIKYCSRPFATVDEMNERLIENWNSCVGVNDRIYIIGDFAFSGHCALLDRLNGQKHLIVGNHDKMTSVVERHFRSVSQMKEIRIKNRKIVMCHYPLRTWNDSRIGSILLFGHTHGRCVTDNLSFDVGVDTHEYKPYSYEEIMQMVVLREIEMAKNHRIVVDDYNGPHTRHYYQDDVLWCKYLINRSSRNEDEK